jgi:hypothetical protein
MLLRVLEVNMYLKITKLNSLVKSPPVVFASIVLISIAIRCYGFSDFIFSLKPLFLTPSRICYFGDFISHTKI